MTQQRSVAEVFRVIDTFLMEEPELTYSRLSQELGISASVAQRILASYADEKEIGCTLLAGIQQSSDLIQYKQINGNDLEEFLQSIPLNNIESLCVVSVWKKQQDPSSLWRSEMQFALSQIKDSTTNQPVWLPQYMTYCWTLSPKQLLRSSHPVYPNSLPSIPPVPPDCPTKPTPRNVPPPSSQSTLFSSSSVRKGSLPSKLHPSNKSSEGKEMFTSASAVSATDIPLTSNKSSPQSSSIQPTAIKHQCVIQHNIENDWTNLFGYHSPTATREINSSLASSLDSEKNQITNTRSLSALLPNDTHQISDNSPYRNSEEALVQHQRRKRPRLISDEEKGGTSKPQSKQFKSNDYVYKVENEIKENEFKLNLTNVQKTDSTTDQLFNESDDRIGENSDSHRRKFDDAIPNSDNLNPTIYPSTYLTKVKVQTRKESKKGKYTVIDTVQEIEVRSILASPDKPNAQNTDNRRAFESKHQSSLFQYFKKP